MLNLAKALYMHANTQTQDFCSVVQHYRSTMGCIKKLQKQSNTFGLWGQLGKQKLYKIFGKTLVFLFCDVF